MFRWSGTFVIVGDGIDEGRFGRSVVNNRRGYANSGAILGWRRGIDRTVREGWICCGSKCQKVLPKTCGITGSKQRRSSSSSSEIFRIDEVRRISSRCCSSLITAAVSLSQRPKWMPEECRPSTVRISESIMKGIISKWISSNPMNVVKRSLS